MSGEILWVKQSATKVLYNSLAQAIIRIKETPHVSLKIFLDTFVLNSSGFTSFSVIQVIIDCYKRKVVSLSRDYYERATLLSKVTFCKCQ